MFKTDRNINRTTLGHPSTRAKLVYTMRLAKVKALKNTKNDNFPFPVVNRKGKVFLTVQYSAQFNNWYIASLPDYSDFSKGGFIQIKDTQKVQKNILQRLKDRLSFAM